MTDQPKNAEADVREQLIRQLFAADRGKRPDEPTLAAYLLSVRKMDTPRLARVVERILDGMQYGDTDPYRVPQPGTLWRVAKEIQAGRLPNTTTQAKAPMPLALEGPASQPVDGWECNGNLLLMNYLWERHAPKGVTRYHEPGALQTLLRWKRGWAADMRDDRADGGQLDGKALWKDYMARAEAEISQHLEAA